MVTSNSLSIAREKLQDSTLPMTLRVSYYLRVSCATLNSSSIRYSNLMNALFTQNSDWIATCTVTAEGYLQSSDSTIATLLSPITDKHLEDQVSALRLPIAA